MPRETSHIPTYLGGIVNFFYWKKEKKNECFTLSWKKESHDTIFISERGLQLLKVFAPPREILYWRPIGSECPISAFYLWPFLTLEHNYLYQESTCCIVLSHGRGSMTSEGGQMTQPGCDDLLPLPEYVTPPQYEIQFSHDLQEDNQIDLIYLL